MFRDRLREKIAEKGVENPDLWPRINSDCLKGEAKEIYERREQAVLAYLTGTSFLDAARRHGLTKQYFSKLIHRCLQPNDDGRIWGFRALLYYEHVKEYDREVEPGPNHEGHHGGYSGAITQLLEKHKDIRDLVIDHFLRKNSDAFIAEPKVSHKRTYLYFKKLCRSKGITDSQYPFCVEKEGRAGLRNYLNRHIKNYYELAKAVYGEDVAKALRVNSLRKRTIPVVLPYQRVELDAHSIDASFEIEIRHPDGDSEVRQLSRFWVIAAREVLTGATLGYSISLKRNYSSLDVRKCIINSLTKWKPRELTVPCLTYSEDGGFPQNRFDQLDGVIYSELGVDNAKAHLAEPTIALLVDRLAIAMNFGPVATPNRRTFVELLFKYLEDNGFHRVPSTHGSKPSDIKGKDPKALAAKYHIKESHLEDIIAVMLWDKNGLQSSHGLGKSPLQKLEYWLSKKLIFPKLSPIQRRTLLMHDIEVTATIRGSMAGKRTPYVQYEGAEYTSDMLMTRFDLTGKKVKLCINSENGGSARAYLLEDGTDLGTLIAKGRWGQWPHSIEMRKQLNWLIDKGRIQLDDYNDPIDVYKEYLLQNGDTRKAAEVERYQRECPYNISNTVTEPHKPQNDNSSATPPDPEAYNQKAYITGKK
jgi:putative transposase